MRVGMCRSQAQERVGKGWWGRGSPSYKGGHKAQTKRMMGHAWQGKC